MARPQQNVYRGKVNIAIKQGGAILNQSTHNAGLSDMALLFAKAISGNINPDSDIPRLLDIGYVVPATNGNAQAGGIWMSILNNPVVIGGRQYAFDTGLNNWVGKLTSTVFYTDVNGGIIDEVLENADQGLYQLKARLCSANPKDRKYFAEIDLTTDEVRQIRESASAIFTWYTELIYNAASQAYTGDVVPNED